MPKSDSLLDEDQSGIWSNILSLKDDEKARIRILSDDKARGFWTHTCRTAEKKRIDVLCTGTQAGCPMCAVNNQPQVKLKANKLRSYPWRKRYVKPVYVYGATENEGQVKLLIGLEVWRKINDIKEMFGTVMDRDIVILRKRAQRVEYSAQADTPNPFTIQVAAEAIPSSEPYFEYLRNNANRAVEVNPNEAPEADDDGSVPPGDYAAPPVAHPPATQASAPAAAAPAAAPAAPAPAQPANQSAVNKSKKQQLLEQFDAMTDKKLDGVKLSKCMKESAPKKAKLDEFDESELITLIGKYSEAVGISS